MLKELWVVMVMNKVNVEFEEYCQSVADRFWNNVDVGNEEDCWEWKGSLSIRGKYGQLMTSFKGVRFLKKGHRLSYLINKGDIPDNLIVCHMCNNSKCCNPNHLYLGTHSDNWNDTIDNGNNYVLPALKGDKSPNSKLNWKKVEEIRNSKESGVVLGKKYGVSRVTISNVRRNLTWVK